MADPIVTQQLVVLGAGGFGREVLDVVDAVNGSRPATAPAFEVLAVLDDGKPDPASLEAFGVPLLGRIEALHDLPLEVGYVIGIGSPQIRRAIDQAFQARPCPVLVHPSVTMGRDVHLGPGTVVCAGARLTNHIRVGRHVHLNLNSTVGHDASLASYVTVSPLVAISGNVILEEGVMIGTGASLNPGITVGAASIIGSGAAVAHDIPPGVMAVGVPAKPRG